MSLSYCTNIHPGESWAEVEAQLRRHLPAVKARACPDRVMGVGLRLSAAAALTLERPERLAAFRRFLDEHDLEVVTLNGFPFGAFHGRRVKDEVYRPDWRDPRRLDYTLRLARLLDALLPPGRAGCVSSVPIGWRRDFQGAEDVGAALSMLARCAEELDRLAQTGGRPIVLALEPEPGCVLETTAEAVALIADHLPDRPIGLCLDACHAAVEFEDPAETARLPRAAGVTIGKVQVSAGIEAPATPEAAARLAEFAEDVWLHQVVEADSEGGLRRFDDLPQAL
ncbi:MAG: metabolite traffic protein EboE, partial [Alphaproteobacteria bacterium]|nr:metabolite traffic protein EboE [Alphaproteobacteria bacterium]